MSVSDSKKVDYLEVDEAIPGQNYVCLSFLSPESFIQNKDAFKCVKFLQSYCKDSKLKFDEVYNKYQDFTYKYEDKLQRDFDEQNDFQTSMRGIKVRGVYDTRQAAEDKAKKLALRDSSFHTFVGQMGYWLPWDPNADKVSDEVFQNGQLNDMMEKYQENNASKDMFYEEQKREKINAAREEVLKAKAEEEAAKKLNQLEASEEYPIDDPVSDKNITEGTTLEEEEDEDEDGIDDKTATEEPVETATEEPVETATEEPEVVKKGSEVSDDIKDSLESDDPWMQRKNSKTAAAVDEDIDG